MVGSKHYDGSLRGSGPFDTYFEALGMFFRIAKLPETTGVDLWRAKPDGRDGDMLLYACFGEPLRKSTRDACHGSTRKLVRAPAGRLSANLLVA